MFFWFQIRQLCNVLYRKLDFSRYPSHVRNLYTYAFKPIIIHVSVYVALERVGGWHPIAHTS